MDPTHAQLCCKRSEIDCRIVPCHVAFLLMVCCCSNSYPDCVADGADISRTDHEVAVCEGSSTELTCPEGQSLMVTSATWGRGDADTCSRGSDQNSRVPFKNVTDTLRQLCDNRCRCDVAADVTSLGEPRAPGSTSPSLYLLANYSCKSILFCSFSFSTVSQIITNSAG